MYYIGTSGYSYPYWKGRFYPDQLPASKWLQYYATQFNTLELNHTFYRFPTVASLIKSANLTPPDFLFSVKAPKVITHIKRLTGVADTIQEFMEVIQAALGNKLSSVLYQMPPSYTFSEERLTNVAEQLSLDNRNVIEFRHVSWWRQEVFDLLCKHRINFCSVSYPGLPAGNMITGNFLYRRMHGVPDLFQSSYSEKELVQLYQELPAGKDAFIFFNNTTFESGYTNAYFLKQLAIQHNAKK
ncbi:DUF72 domain-containing protein [Niabella sp. CC-SYL272]|uniref:DUF72 domain-containing protein n=1 Tax=Niabella agricola TaxID=2891571 RepID=UPI001F317E51|nr:DUF72 domain-containing protein [Niabella agricola]MCF3111908.1 DUF72 domain-containing protein [Niabella agricola]